MLFDQHKIYNVYFIPIINYLIDKNMKMPFNITNTH